MVVPPNHPLKNRVFHVSHPFCGTTILGNTHISNSSPKSNIISPVTWIQAMACVYSECIRAHLWYYLWPCRTDKDILVNYSDGSVLFSKIRKESLKETQQFRWKLCENSPCSWTKSSTDWYFQIWAPTFDGLILEDYCWWLSSWYGKWPFYFSADCFSIRNYYIFIDFAISTECSKPPKILESFGVEEGVRYPPCN